MFNREAYDTMMAQEVEYLRANGWVQDGPDEWSSTELNRTRLRQGHAVNVQKQYDRFQSRGLPWVMPLADV